MDTSKYPEEIPPKMRELGKRGFELARKLRDQAVEIAKLRAESGIEIESGPFDQMDTAQYESLCEALVVLLGWELYSVWLGEVRGDGTVDPRLSDVVLFLMEALMWYEDEQTKKV
jgi:hypothetical protein